MLARLRYGKTKTESKKIFLRCYTACLFVVHVKTHKRYIYSCVQSLHIFDAYTRICVAQLLIYYEMHVFLFQFFCILQIHLGARFVFVCECVVVRSPLLLRRHAQVYIKPYMCIYYSACKYIMNGPQKRKKTVYKTECLNETERNNKRNNNNKNNLSSCCLVKFQYTSLAITMIPK